MYQFRSNQIYELIETLWNVNKRIRAGCDVGKHRINRNIVECKSSTVLNTDSALKGINRNIVECK